MTKNAQDYARMCEQLEELKKKMDAKKVIVDKERDEEVVRAMHIRDISFEDAMQLVKVINNPEYFKKLMSMTLDEEPVIPKRRRRNKNELEIAPVIEDVSIESEV